MDGSPMADTNTAEQILIQANPFHASNWPRSIARPEDYAGGDDLVVSFDLGAVPEAEKKRVIKAWCARLPELQHLRRLILWSQVTPPVFEAACRIRGLESLQIKWSNLTSLEPLTALGQLRNLWIGSSTRITAIEPLATLRELRFLSIENFKLIQDFTPLEQLTSLETLWVTGSMWTRQYVGSLETFARMHWLRSLALDTKYVTSLRPLAALKGLKSLDVGGKLPLEEYAWLAGKLPQTRCRWFAPWLDVAGRGFNACERCKRDAKVLATGRGGGLMCRYCDEAKLRKRSDAFDSARRAAADEAG
jgi:hypothetical protein